ncbi:hypothetical protein M8C21_024605 [Ambrosia artemisiifolia]|uniref:Transposase (putative) gypsy type domain-containing protein n=1 Tax=Ambrosia artemisiifolia TaxID=4212 RepID=A0AAD5GLT2_AMBAR|nr:hypothetical protein M8C21_024605 [Ambrosia artemisiifolia]
MVGKRDMHLHGSVVSEPSLTAFCSKFFDTSVYKPIVPKPSDKITNCPPNHIGFYTRHFDFASLRLPLSVFFLEFLQFYGIDICQLSPLGAQKVVHFEVVCRSLGGDPTIGLFRQFFHLTTAGDWYTVGEISKTKSMLSDTYSGLKGWKNRFFWMPNNVVPFGMPWHGSKDALNHKQEDVFDGELYDKLLATRTPLQVFPEPILVLTGISRMWPFPEAEPIIKKGKKEMSVLGFVKRKGKDMVLTSRALAPNEDNILVRTASATYDIPATEQEDIPRAPRGGNLSLEQHPISPQGSKPDTSPSHHSVSEDAGSKDHHSGSPLRDDSPERNPPSPKDVSPSGDVVIGIKAQKTKSTPARKEHHRKRKEVAEESDDVHQLEKKARILHHAIPPGELDRARGKKDEYAAEGASVSVVRTLSSISELVQSYYKKLAMEKKLKRKVGEYRSEVEQLTAKLAKRKKGDRSSVRKGKEAIRAMGEMKVEHEREMEAVRSKLSDQEKEMEALKEKLRLSDEQNVTLTRSVNSLEERISKVADEKKAWSVCKDNYDKALEAGEKVMDQLRLFNEEAEKDRDRLVTSIIPSTAYKLLKSVEFLQPLGDMESLLYNSAYHDGLVAGWKAKEEGMKLGDVDGYNVKATEEYEEGAKKWDNTTYEFLEKFKAMAGKPVKEVEELLPSSVLPS